jgi:hypothetical protein
MLYAMQLERHPREWSNWHMKNLTRGLASAGFLIILSALSSPSYCQDTSGWSVPVALGESMSMVWTILGKPMPKTAWDEGLAVEWFPDSGITVWYDTNTTRVWQLMLHGENRPTFRAYKGTVLHGLRTTDNITMWKKVLGKPASATKVPHGSNLITYEWKRKSYLVTVETWAGNFSDSTGSHRKGFIPFMTLRNIAKAK